MIQPILQLLLACSGILWAQPTDITVTAAFTNGQSRYLLGNEINGIAVDIIPSATQTISPNTTGFIQLLLAQARVTVTGNPFLTSFAVGSQELNIIVASGHQSTKLPATLSIDYEYSSVVMGPRPVMRLGFSRNLVTPVAGVAYSFADQTITLWDALFPSPPPTTYDIRGRATRATLSVSINSLRISAVAGQPETRTFTVNAPPGASLSASYGYVNAPPALSASYGYVFLSFNGNVATATVNHTFQKPTAASFLEMIWADGIPPVYLPVQVDFIPSDKFLRLSPTELTFVYTQGASPLPPQLVNVVTSETATISNGSFDSGWMSATQSANQITVNSILTNKPPGRHRTILREFASPGYFVAELYINFYVNNGPGTIIATSQPATAGIVRTTPASGYTNGATVTLTAEPVLGFNFGRWTGAINDTKNPISFVLNGPTTVTAEFLPITGQCTYTLNPPAILTSARADVGRVEIRTQSGCPWTVSQLPSWMRLNSPTSGTGSGSFSYTLDAVPNVTAFLRVADSYFKVEKTTCTSLSPIATESVPAAGGEIGVRASEYGCYYTLRASQPWLQSPIPDIYWLSTPQFAITAQPNNTGTPRTASLSVAGFRTPFVQRAATPTAPYDDVTETNLFSDHIAILKTNNAADNCGPNRFCPDDRMLRSQMAELLVRARLGTDTFTFSGTPVFQDVPAIHPQFKWIQKLAELNITNGCAANQFCPADGVTRAQMALFLLRARAAIPPSTTLDNTFGTNPFIDVPSDSAAAPFIAKMREWGVTNGCYENAYCPDDFTTRGQMAAFLVRAFFTPY